MISEGFDTVSGPYVSSGGVNYTFSFPCTSKNNVTVTTSVSSVETTLVLDSDYTVALNPDQGSAPGGTVTLLVAPAVGLIIAIESSIPLKQSLDLTQGGAFNPDTIEQSLDDLVMLIGQLEEAVGRAVKAQVTNPIDGDALVASLYTSAANAAQSAFNADASADLAAASEIACQGYAATINPAVLQPLDNELTAISGVTAAPDKGIHFTGSNAAATHTLTAYARTLLDDADAATARATLAAQQASEGYYATVGSVGVTLWSAGALNSAANEFEVSFAGFSLNNATPLALAFSSDAGVPLVGSVSNGASSATHSGTKVALAVTGAAAGQWYGRFTMARCFTNKKWVLTGQTWNSAVSGVNTVVAFMDFGSYTLNINFSSLDGVGALDITGDVGSWNIYSR